MACINPSDPRFQEILQRVENPLLAELEYERFLNSNNSEVNYFLKAVEILASPKAKEVFKKGEKSNWDLNKILTELQVPKNQKQMIINAYDNKLFETEGQLIEPSIEDIITHLLAENSFTVEINTAKITEGNIALARARDDIYEDRPDLELGSEEFEKAVQERLKETTSNTAYYSNLTVPGGTNYTENEIATPAITPSIKGHAQFSTDNGIGWFRSDDKLFKNEIRPNTGNEIEDVFGTPTIVYGENTKTRRILEVQSDLFQKGRDRDALVAFQQNVLGLPFEDADIAEAAGGVEYLVGQGKITEEEGNKRIKELEDNWKKRKSSSENQFLQLLNKDNNWVTFFVKSIIQDSAKKGYEKVLFPVGDTASKIEGHTTLEEFKKQKEDRIKVLEAGLNLKPDPNIDFTKYSFRELKDMGYDYLGNEDGKAIWKPLVKDKTEALNEINQLKQELERVETEGFGALKPIYNFYENTVTNILKKQGYNPIEITDEYGNAWNEIEVIEKRDLSPVFLQKKGTEIAPTSPRVISMLKDFIKRIGVDIKSLQEIEANGQKFDANGAALLMQKLIGVADGKEAQALPEEAMHFAVAIIKQTNPALYKKLLSEINTYNTLKEVFADYGNDPRYQTSEGKPDVIKLKEEAIAKVLADVIINQLDGSNESSERLAKTQSWWKSILDWLKNLFFVKSGFDQAAMDIISGKEIGTADDIREKNDAEFLQKTAQSIIFDKLKDISQRVEKKPDENGEDKYFINGKKIKRRVSDLSKSFYKNRQAAQDITKSEYENAVDSLKAEKGTAGHADLEHAFEVFVDEDGYIRDIPLDDSTYVSQINPNNNDMYNLLKENLRQRLNSYPTGTRFLSEIVIIDEKRDIGGTVDFVAIEPDGKVNILDWKFMGLNTLKYEDVPWYKVQSWNIQMNQYKYIIQTVYGVKSEDFRHTRMIPILADWSHGTPKKFEEKGKEALPKLNSIKIGDVEVKNINQPYLMPVPLKGEKTGNRNLDKFIERLNLAYDKLSDIKVTPEQKENKRDQLNSLFTAIRHLQLQEDIKPLIYQAQVLSNQVKVIIDEYNEKFKGKDPLSFEDSKISKFVEDLDTTQFAISNYTDMYNDLRQIVGDDLEMKEKLRDISDDARQYQKDLNEILNDFTNDIIVARDGIENFLSPEKVIRGLARWFSSTATLQTKAIQALYRKANKAFSFAAMSNQSEIATLEDIKNRYQEWAQSKGFTGKDLFKAIKKSKGNELIDQYQPEFYSTLKSKIAEKDFKWIRDNIDKKEVIKNIKGALEKELERIDNKPRSGTDQDEFDIKREKQKARDLYNVSTSTSAGWLIYDIVSHSPDAQKWETDEWKFLNASGNEAAKDFYDYIISKNNEYANIGYIHKKNARIFLPYVRKSFTEKLVTEGKVEIGREFLESISVDEGTVGFGQIDPVTGRPVNKIPKYFTTMLDEEVSEDLFRTMALYNEAALRYKYLSDIEAQLRAIQNVERNKKSIATSIFGNIQRKEGEIETNRENNSNSELYDDMMKSIVYGQKYIDSQAFDSVLFKIGSWGKTFNEKLGMKVFPEDLSERQVSVNRSVDSLNNTFQITTLGLNVLSSTSNFFGGNAQSIINAGKYFTKTDYIASEAQFFINKFNGEDKKKFTAALHYFLPFTDNYNRELTKQLSVNNFTQESFQDFLMILMRKGDQAVQAANFYAFLKNTIVQDGKIVNVREYLRTLPEYATKYSGTVSERKEFDARFEERVAELIKEKGVMNVATVENNQFVIPGVERLSNSVVEVRRKVQQVNKDALGNLSEDDLRSINMTIFGKSFMVFKNWIPRLVDVRLGGLKYNAASDAYEWGRMRMIFSTLYDNFNEGAEALFGILAGNEKGVELMRKTFEKRKAQYEEETGRTLMMTEELFIDMMRHNIQSSIWDLGITSSLMSLVASLKLYPPDEDENPAVINQYRFFVRALDKFKDELMYFYDPTSITSLVRGGLFPSVSLLENGVKTIKNMLTEMYGLGIGDEQLVKDTKVIKYAMKSFPFTNQMVGYLPLFYPELAKDLGIRVQSNYGIR